MMLGFFFNYYCYYYFLTAQNLNVISFDVNVSTVYNPSGRVQTLSEHKGKQGDVISVPPLSLLFG